MTGRASKARYRPIADVAYRTVKFDVNWKPAGTYLDKHMSPRPEVGKLVSPSSVLKERYIADLSIDA